MSAMHYSGTIIGPRICVYPGWAACCSGERTMKLRREGRVTPDRALVTCKRCLALIAGHDKWQADAPLRRAEHFGEAPPAPGGTAGSGKP